MSPIPHVLHIYNKPKAAIREGQRFITRYAALDYKHKISAMGGFDTASCRIAVLPDEAQTVFQDYLGCRVGVYVDNHIPIWEGFINRVNIQMGRIRLSRSMDKLTNRVSVTYQDTTTTPGTKITTESATAASIAIYGSKAGTKDIQTQYSAGASIAAAQRNKMLAQQSYPTTTTARADGSDFKVEIEMLGFYHTLAWDTFSVTNVGVADAGSLVFLYMFNTVPPQAATVTGFNSSQAAGNSNGVFYNDRDFTEWRANASFTKTLEKRMGESHWNYIKGVVEGGDGVNNWVCGITPTLPNLGYRRGYYRPANTAIVYLANAFGSDDIYTLQGQRVLPWRVVPDRSIRIQDLLVGYNQPGVDPRSAYIESVVYDAEQQVVQWSSRDDITPGGVFNQNQVYLETNVLFGAAPRGAYI